MFRSLREYMYDAAYGLGYAIGRHLRPTIVPSVDANTYLDYVAAAEAEAQIEADLNTVRHTIRTNKVALNANLAIHIGLAVDDIKRWETELATKDAT